MSKLQEKTKKIAIRPFANEITIVLTNDLTASLQKRVKTIGEVSLGSTALACVWMADHTTELFMFLPKKVNLATIVHESVHVIHHVFTQNGLAFDTENLAYHIDDLFEKVAQFVYPVPKRRVDKKKSA